MLKVVGTPIGNLADASERLRRTLREASVIAAEDTRELRKLALGLGVELSAELISLHEHNELQKLDRLVEIASQGELVLVSDAGMPTISDPGFALVRACRERKIEVQVVPGPSAVLAALAVSGLPTDRFTFEGFLPRKSGERLALFRTLQRESRTMVFFESPHRIEASLRDASAIFGSDRLASLSRELTKLFEETRHATLGELAEELGELKGELVLVIEGASKPEANPEELVHEVLRLREGGASLKEAVSLIAKEHSVSSSELYSLAVKRK